MIRFMIFALCAAGEGLGLEKSWREGLIPREGKSSNLNKRTFGLLDFFRSKKSTQRPGLECRRLGTQGHLGPRPQEARSESQEEEVTLPPLEEGLRSDQGATGGGEWEQNFNRCSPKKAISEAVYLPVAPVMPTIILPSCARSFQDGVYDAHFCLPIVVGNKSMTVSIPITILPRKADTTTRLEPATEVVRLTALPPPVAAPAFPPALASLHKSKPDMLSPNSTKKEEPPPRQASPQLNSVVYELLKQIRETSLAHNSSYNYFT